MSLRLTHVRHVLVAVLMLGSLAYAVEVNGGLRSILEWFSVTGVVCALVMAAYFWLMWSASGVLRRRLKRKPKYSLADLPESIRNAPYVMGSYSMFSSGYEDPDRNMGVFDDGGE